MPGIAVAAAVLIFLTAVLGMSLSFHVFYDGQFKVKARYGPFFITVYPREEKPVKKKEKAKGKPAKKKPQKPSETEKQGFFETVSFVLDMIKSALGPAWFIIKKTRISSLFVRVIVATGDAAETAKQYGYMCASVYGFVGGLKNLKKTGIKKLFVGYDFDKTENEYKVSFKIKIRAVWAIFAALVFFKNVMVNVFRKEEPDIKATT